jgi:hypothetical protein
LARLSLSFLIRIKYWVILTNLGEEEYQHLHQPSTSLQISGSPLLTLLFDEAWPVEQVFVDLLHGFLKIPKIK